MRAILIFLMLAITIASASAEDDRVLADRLAQLVRDERNRQDCMWRETLTRLRAETSQTAQEIAGAVAYICSENIRKRLLENIRPETELPQKEGITFDELAAAQRALSIGRQIKEIEDKSRTKAPN
jgi:hypothetical protein